MSNLLNTYRIYQASSNSYKATCQKCSTKIDGGEYRIIWNRHSPLKTTTKFIEVSKIFHLGCFYKTEHVSEVKHLLDLDKYILPSRSHDSESRKSLTASD